MYELVDRYWFGIEKLYGYKALRVCRQVLLTELQRVVEQASVRVQHDNKFSHVTHQEDSSVTFELADGTVQTAAMLIGADGIHSRVRRYVCPGIVPHYYGQLAITCALPTSGLRFPHAKDCTLPISIHAKNGAFVMAP